MANTYHTGNPIGSKDVRDLSDNASDFDYAVNSPLPSWEDRFNMRRQTWAGMEAAFQDFLTASGFAYIGDYAAGLTFTARNQYVVRSGLAYRLATSTNLPYTLTGTWSTDQAKLVVFDSSGALGQNLLNAVDPTKGISLVGGGLRFVDSADDIRALPSAAKAAYWMGIGGYLPAVGNTAADNGGTILVATDGTRWVLQDANFTSAVFGAVPGNSVDATAAIQSNISARKITGGVVEIDSGRFKVSGGSGLIGSLDLDLSAINAEPVTNSQRVSIQGKGRGHTVLMGSTPSAFALSVRSAAGVASHMHSRIEGLGFGGTSGLYAYDLAYVTFHDLGFWGMNTCMRLDSVLSADFEDIIFSDSAIGVTATRGAGYSGINAVSFRKCVFRVLSNLAASFGGPVVNASFEGGSVEACGTMGASASGGLAFSFDGAEGGVGASFDGMYFEGNAGEFDVSLFNSGTSIVTSVFKACNFNRISSSRYTLNNIRATGGPQRIILIGCTFNGYNDYAEVANRLYVNAGPGIEVICIGCVFGSTAAQGTLRNLDASVTFNGQISSTGGVNYMPNGWTAQRIAAGTYTITHNLSAPTAKQSLSCSAISASAVQFQRWINTSANSFTVVMATPAGVLTDTDFSFQFGIG